MDPQAIPATSYQHPDTVVRWINDTKGFGLFALRTIKKGKMVTRSTGQILSREKYEELPRVAKDMSYEVGEDQFFAPRDPEHIEDDWRVNHSCDANLGNVDDFTLIAMRDIEADEELTYDYATTDANEEDLNGFECCCGSAVCRKWIRPTDWQRLDVREHYRDFFQTNVQRLIDTLEGRTA